VLRSDAAFSLAALAALRSTQTIGGSRSLGGGGGGAAARRDIAPGASVRRDLVRRCGARRRCQTGLANIDEWPQRSVQRKCQRVMTLTNFDERAT
jgi:hypothetical protein